MDDAYDSMRHSVVVVFRQLTLLLQCLLNALSSEITTVRRLA